MGESEHSSSDTERDETDIPITSLPTIHHGEGDEYDALEHLLKARFHARRAESLFTDGSKGESVANNTRRWADKSVGVAEQYLQTDTDGSP